MTIEELIRGHNREMYDGPEADVCSACREVVRDGHVCRNERRGGLQRRIPKPLPENSPGAVRRRATTGYGPEFVSGPNWGSLVGVYRERRT